MQRIERVPHGLGSRVQPPDVADALHVARRALPPATVSLGILLTGVANAATIAVTADAVDDVVDGNCSLVEALRAANTDQVVDGCAAGDMVDTLHLPAGSTFTLSSPDNSTYGPTGLPVVSSVLIIQGNGAVIQRDAGAPDFRIFAIAEGGDLTVSHSTISGGAIAADFPSGHGGGMANYGGSLTLDGVIVANSSAGFSGGGVFNDSATTTLIESTISGNSAASSGGGISSTGGSIALTESRVAGNSAGADGGGIRSSDGTVTLTNSTVEGNSASTYANGGGIYSAGSSGSISLYGSTVSDNSAGQNGGGILNAGGSATVTNSTVSGNSAGYQGGGISTPAFASNSSTITLVNSTVTGNMAVDRGGGIFNGFSNYGYNTVSLTNTLVAGNSAGGAGTEIATDSFGAAVYASQSNLFGYAGAGSAFDGFTPGPSDIDATSGGINAALTSILDVTLDASGGPTQTHRLPVDSPAIDAVAGSCSSSIGQRGIGRPQDGDSNGVALCDIGAVEFVGANVDSDGDGMLDRYEITNGLDPNADDASGDLDGDGLRNFDEFNSDTQADNPDTDSDGIGDLRDVDSTTDNNACVPDALGPGQTEFDVTALSGLTTQCAAKSLIIFRGTAVVETGPPGAELQLIAPTVGFEPMTRIPQGALLSVEATDPVPSLP